MDKLKWLLCWVGFYFFRLRFGYGFCYRCRKPWSLIEGHVTCYVTGIYGRGCFPLCESCWSKLTPELRMSYYDRLVDQWISHSDTPAETGELEKRRALIHAAVLRGE